MENLFLALLVKSIFMLVVFGCIVLPIEFAAKKYLPEGRIKRILFKKIS